MLASGRIVAPEALDAEKEPSANSKAVSIVISPE